jgi:hypothetical protein
MRGRVAPARRRGLAKSGEAHGGRLLRTERRQGVLPQQALDACDTALVLDRLPKLLVEALISEGVVASPYHTHVNLRRSLGSFEPLAWEDEGSAHSKDSTEQACFEDDIVSRRGLTGFRDRGRGRPGCSPVVPRKYERGEVDFMRKLEEAD